MAANSSPVARPPERSIEPRLTRRFAAFHHRNFTLLWAAALVSNSGTWMQIVAQGWLVFNLTNSPFYLGLVGFAKAVPMVLLPPMGGVIADRVPRLKLMKVTQSISIVLAAILGLLVSTGLVQVWHIVLLSFLGGIVNSFDTPTQQALLPDLVPREDLGPAVALNSAAWQGAALFGPTLAGLAVAVIGIAGAFYANAISYLAVVVALFFIRGVKERSGGTPRGMFDDLREGLRYVGASRLVMTLLVLGAITSLFGRSYQQLLPAFAKDVMHTGATGLGFMMSAPGAGALVGATLVSSAHSIDRKGRLFFLGMISFGASLVLFSFTHNFLVSLALLFVVGLTWILFSTMLVTMIQLEVPGQMRGRVMSLVTVTMQGFQPLGALITGSLATATGTPVAVTLGAALVIGAALVAAVRAPVVRQYVTRVAASAPS